MINVKHASAPHTTTRSSVCLCAPSPSFFTPTRVSISFRLDFIHRLASHRRHVHALREASSASLQRMEPNGMEAARASHLDWLASLASLSSPAPLALRPSPTFWGWARRQWQCRGSCAMDMVLFSSEVAPDADEDAVSQVTSTHAEHVIDPDGNDDFGAVVYRSCPLHLPMTTGLCLTVCVLARRRGQRE